jgi:hypothetical protein
MNMPANVFDCIKASVTRFRTNCCSSVVPVLSSGTLGGGIDAGGALGAGLVVNVNPPDRRAASAARTADLRPNVGRFFLRFIVDAAMAADNGSDEGAIVTPAVAVAAAAAAGAEAAVEVELEGVPVDGAALLTLCCASAFGSCLCSCVSDEALAGWCAVVGGNWTA